MDFEICHHFVKVPGDVEGTYRFSIRRNRDEYTAKALSRKTFFEIDLSFWSLVAPVAASSATSGDDVWAFGRKSDYQIINMFPYVLPADKDLWEAENVAFGAHVVGSVPRSVFPKLLSLHLWFGDEPRPVAGDDKQLRRVYRGASFVTNKEISRG